MKFLIDSDVLIDILRGIKGSREFLRHLWREGELCISLINVAEISSGKEMKGEKKTKVLDFLNEFTILGFDFELAVNAGEIRRDYDIPFADSIIAALALKYDCFLVTFDHHFQVIKGLRVLRPEYREGAKTPLGN